MRALAFDQAAPSTRRRNLPALAFRALPPLLGAATVGGLAASNGGYFAGTCAWASLGLLWFAVLALLLRSEVSIGVHGFVLIGALALFVGWSALSWLWTSSVTLTVLDVQKLLVYLGLVLAALLVVSRGTVPALLGGVLAGDAAVCAYALATRLFPERLGTFDPLSGYRLTTPVGYWNALGLFAGLGVLLAAGFAARAAMLWWRAASAAVLPLLMATFFFTFSRGAWASLAVGVVAALALDRRRLVLLGKWLVLAPWPAIVVVLADRSHALTTTNARHPDGPPDQEPRDEADLESEVLRRLGLRAALAQLDDRDRELLALRFGADLTASHIGDLVGMKTNAVEVALHRALTRLRKLLDDERASEAVAHFRLEPGPPRSA